MDDLERAISRAVQLYAFDRARACQSLLEWVETERAVLKCLGDEVPREVVMERRLSLNNLHILCIALME